MSRRALVVGITLATLSPAVARPQSVEIDHKAVACIVVGKYPKMSSCFTPASSLARARVYFRPEGTPSWYYVEMKSDQPCYTGILPRPGKKLVGRKIDYYVEAQDRGFNVGRTAEYNPIVVRSAEECEKKAPAAPFVNNAAVAVFPALPAGFVGGGAIGTGAILGVAAAGAAVAGAAVAAGDGHNPAPTLGGGGNTTTTTPAASNATTTTTTTLPLSGNRPPFAVLTTNPDPPQGLSPLTVAFNLCKSSDPDGDPLSFFFDFGDGGKASGACVQTHTYTASSLRGLSALDSGYTAEACAVDPRGLSQCRTRNVIAQLPPPPPPATTPPTPPPPTTPSSPFSCPSPRLTIDSPTAGQCFTSASIPVSATGVGTTGFVTFTADYTGPSCTFPATVAATLTVVGPGPTYAGTLDVSSTGLGCYTIRANALKCSSIISVGVFPIVAAPVAGVQVRPSGCLVVGPARGLEDRSAPITWSSDLALEGGRLQVVVNGAASFPGAGRSLGTSVLADGENRVEATVVEAAGKSGLWRFNIPHAEEVAPGSLHVVAGDVVAVAAGSVTFRLEGTRGERVTFTFSRK